MGEPKQDFEEADRRYAELKRLYESGDVSEQEFEEQLKRLMVQDESGRWWAKSRKSGEWNYHDGSGWVRDMPPHYAPPTPSAVRSIRRSWLPRFALRGGQTALLMRYLVAFVVAFVVVFVMASLVVVAMALLEALQTGGSPCIAVSTARWCF